MPSSAPASTQLSFFLRCSSIASVIRAILTSGSMRSLRRKPDRSCATKPGHISCHRQDRIIVLELDNAGWHTAPNLVVPDGIRLVYLPRYSPELQPAEHLWPVLDEPLANQYFETLADLERAVADRCKVL